MAIIKDPLAGLTKPSPSHHDTQIIDALTSMRPYEWAALTGAGMSTDSGIPDYRSPNSPKRTPMTYQVFTTDPKQRTRYWARSYLGWERVDSAKPNLGHLTLATIPVCGIVTQNVDGLHERAATQVAASRANAAPQPAKAAALETEPENIVDLHGRLDRVICLNCGKLYKRHWVQNELHLRNPGFLENLSLPAAHIETAPDGDVALAETDSFIVLPCPACGGVLKPDVVFFGENVPRERVARANEIVDAAHGLVVLGSSLAVLSGLRFVKHAAATGKPVIIVTDGPSRGDEYAVFRSTTRVGDFVQKWAAALT